MNNQIINEKVITSSLSETLFGVGRRRQVRLMASMLPKTLHEVCVFYSAIVQAYLIGIAQKKGVKITELKEYSSISSAVSKIWTEGRSIDDKKIFSFIDICKGNEDIALKEVEGFIGVWGEAYAKLMNPDVNAIDYGVTTEDFVAFLRALPLLSQTEIDKENNKLIIKNGKYEIECSCFPYLAFYEYNKDMECDCLCKNVTNNCYVLTSVAPGERDGELHFHYTKINSAEPVALTSKEKGKVYESENLILICRSVGIKVEWNEDSYWCDFAFIKKLADIMNESLLKTLDLDSPQRATSDVRGRLEPLFKGTSLEGVVPAKILYPSSIKMFIYELFITQGIFKTVYSLMFVGRGSQTKSVCEKLFNAIMLTFKKNCVISESEYKEKIEECNRAIAAHIIKLKKIVQKDTGAYQHREMEIYAEQRTLCILHAAGIKNDNIVADAEELMSLDDFYDMFVNPETSINDDLSSLMSLLCCFYGALLQNSKEFDSDKYYKDVYKLRKTYAEEKGLEFLFESFVEIVKDSQGSEVIDKLIGRNCICDLNKLIGFKKKILELKEENEDKFSYFNEESPSSDNVYGDSDAPVMFISYSRLDDQPEDPKIKQFVNKMKEKKIKVFFDVNEIDSGDTWRVRVQNAIRDKRTVMVVMFISRASVLSESIEFELSVANKESKRRFPGDSPTDKDNRNHFILAINLEEDRIEDFIDEMWIDPQYDDNIKARIEKYRRIISQKTFRRIHETDIIAKNFADNVKNNASVTPYPKVYGDETDEFRLQIKSQVKNFFCFLKYGDNYQWHEIDEIDEYFNAENADTSYCVFPMLASVRETQIKRDNITVIGYEIISGKGRENKPSNYILYSKKLAVEEYYCIPNYKTVGENCSWMVEPLLISHDKFIGKNEDK